jgi:hypothetical protein
VPKAEISMYSERGAEMEITFNDYDFTEPIEINHWTPPHAAGLYAILIPDGTGSPRPFKVIYFGELEDLAESEFFRSHQRYRCWMQWAKSEDDLYIAVYLMPSSSAGERLHAESTLISAYQPACNPQF